MRQAQDIWLILKVREASIRLNEAGKAHDNAITTCNKGVLLNDENGEVPHPNPQ